MSKVPEREPLMFRSPIDLEDLIFSIQETRAVALEIVEQLSELERDAIELRTPAARSDRPEN
jgi:hypothetical protein